MVTFTEDSLNFEDDEKVRFGDGDDYDLEYSSADDRAELTHAPTGAASAAYIPRGRGGDLVGGRLAETVADGKALADDGNTYDSIQAAVNAASSWVKVGEGTFDEAVTISVSNLVLSGSGPQTRVISSTGDAVEVASDGVVVRDLTANHTGDSGQAVHLNANNGRVFNVTVEESSGGGIVIDTEMSECVIANCTVKNTGVHGIVSTYQSNYWSGKNMIVNNRVEDAGTNGIRIHCADSIVAFNTVIRAGQYGIDTFRHDTIIIGNRVHDTDDDGIVSRGDDNILANNRVSGSDVSNVSDSGSGAVLDGNLTGDAN